MGQPLLPRAHLLALSLLILLPASCSRSGDGTADQAPPDEAKKRNLTAAYFVPAPEHVEDYFRDMDTISEADVAADAWPDQLLDLKDRPKRRVGPPQLNTSEQLGRNTWMIWCGGNERFWDWLSSNSHGFLDFVKLLDSHDRPTRWKNAGLVNEPGMIPATAADQFGLWLDLPADPKAREYRDKYIQAAFEEFERYGGYKTYG